MSGDEITERVQKAIAWAAALVAAPDRKQARIIVFDFDEGPHDLLDAYLTALRIDDLTSTGVTTLYIETASRSRRGYVSMANDLAIIGARGVLKKRGRDDILNSLSWESEVSAATRRLIVLPPAVHDIHPVIPSRVRLWW